MQNNHEIISLRSKTCKKILLHTAFFEAEVILALHFRCISSFDSRLLLMILFLLFLHAVSFFRILLPSSPSFCRYEWLCSILTDNIAQKEKAYVHQHIFYYYPHNFFNNIWCQIFSFTIRWCIILWTFRKHHVWCHQFLNQ